MPSYKMHCQSCEARLALKPIRAVIRKGIHFAWVWVRDCFCDYAMVRKKAGDKEEEGMPSVTWNRPNPLLPTRLPANVEYLR